MVKGAEMTKCSSPVWRQKSSFAYLGQFFRTFKASLRFWSQHASSGFHARRKAAAELPSWRAEHGDAATLPSQGLSRLVWVLCAYGCLGMRVPWAEPARLARVRPFLPCWPQLLQLAPEEGKTWPLQKSIHCQTSLREEFNFSLFQSFFRDHKYLLRACQSFLGFLTECVTREGLLWGFIVNCSKLYSWQGARRSHTVSGERKQSPQYGNDALGWSCPLPQESLRSLHTSRAFSVLKLQRGIVRRNSLFLGRSHSKRS